MTAPDVAHSRPGLAITAGGTLLAMAAFSAPLSIVPSIADGLGAGAIGTAWLLSSMSLGLAVALLTSGAIGDVVGRRRVFVLGAALLAVGCAASALAPGTALFVAGRIVQGVGSAAVMACGLALISVSTEPGPERSPATAVWGASMGAGPAVGPLLGALCDAAGSWRWSYVVLAAASVALAVAGRAWLDESRAGAGRRVDVVGALLLGAGLGCLLTALTEGRQGWTAPLVLVLAATAVVLLGAVVVHLRRTPDPLVPLRLFRKPALVAATVAAAVTGGCMIALVSFVGTVLERGMGDSPVTTSVLLLAWSATSAVAALLMRRLPPHVSGGTRFGVGMLVMAAGLVPLAMLDAGSGMWALVPGLLVAGAGTGVANATLGREAVATVPPDRAATGSGINNAARYVGAAFGVTVVTVLAIRPGGDPVHGLIDGWNVAVAVGIVVTLAGAVLIPLLYRADRRRAGRAVTPIPPPSPVTSVRRPPGGP